MSDAVSYLSEPPTHGKVLLHTTFGDVDVELFSSSAPSACRLFTALCLRHHYDGLPFHRLIPRFLVQTGDKPLPHLPPTVSLPSKPELHSRLRFNRRGLVGMAAPAAEQMRSLDGQFFVTLAAAEELTGQHVLFGKVTGDTLYNLIRLDELEVRGEAPVNPPQVKGVEVLICPWEGMREEAEKEEAEERQRKKEEEARRKKADGGGRLAKRNVQLLSFGSEGDEEPRVETEGAQRKGKGIHAVVKDDTRLGRAQDEEKRAASQRVPSSDARASPSAEVGGMDRREQDTLGQSAQSTQESEEELDEAEFDAVMRARAMQSSSRPLASTATAPAAVAVPAASSSSESSLTLKLRVKALARQVLGGGSAASVPALSSDTSEPAPRVSALERRQQAFLARKKTKLSNAASATLDKLAQFKQSIHSAPSPPPPPKPSPAATARGPDEGEGEEDAGMEEDGKGWLRHRLQFAQRPQDFEKEDEGDAGFVVLDPRGVEGRMAGAVRMGKGGRGVKWTEDGGQGRRGEDGKRRSRKDRDDEGESSQKLPAELQAQVDAISRERQQMRDGGGGSSAKSR